jgi:hypothetical protein
MTDKYISKISLKKGKPTIKGTRMTAATLRRDGTLVYSTPEGSIYKLDKVFWFVSWESRFYRDIEAVELEISSLPTTEVTP